MTSAMFRELKKERLKAEIWIKTQYITGSSAFGALDI